MMISPWDDIARRTRKDLLILIAVDRGWSDDAFLDIGDATIAEALGEWVILPWMSSWSLSICSTALTFLPLLTGSYSYSVSGQRGDDEHRVAADRESMREKVCGLDLGKQSAGSPPCQQNIVASTDMNGRAERDENGFEAFSKFKNASKFMDSRCISLFFFSLQKNVHARFLTHLIPESLSASQLTAGYDLGRGVQRPPTRHTRSAVPSSTCSSHVRKTLQKEKQDEKERGSKKYTGS
jgi:hypothetical protein